MLGVGALAAATVDELGGFVLRGHELAVLTGRGLLRALCEGGPTLLGTFVERDLLDELCLTTAPVLVGGAAPRIATGPGNVLTRLRRAHLITDTDGYLYGRYTRVS